MVRSSLDGILDAARFPHVVRHPHLADPRSLVRGGSTLGQVATLRVGPRRSTAGGGIAHLQSRTVVVAFRLLGAIEVVVDGVDVTPAAPKERALLAMLVLDAGHVLAPTGSSTSCGRASTPSGHVTPCTFGWRRCASSSGRRTGRHGWSSWPLDTASKPTPTRSTSSGSWPWWTGPGARADDANAAATMLREALGLWRGTEPLGGVPLGPDLAAEAARLADARLDAIEDCIDAELGCGYHQALTYELDRLVAEHPLRERLGAQRATRPLPLRPPGRGAAGVQRHPPPPRRRRRHRTGTGAARPRAGRARAAPGLDWAPPRERSADGSRPRRATARCATPPRRAG